MTWVVAYFCARCQGELTEAQATDRRGTCPLCGAPPDTTAVSMVRRWVWDRKPAWWKFWDAGEGHWRYAE